METTQFYVKLPIALGRAVLAMADQDCREPRQQVEYVLRQEAQRRGLLAREQEQEGERDAAAHA